MKTKISMVAALGLLGGFNAHAAVPFEEALKGIEFSGYLRYRFYDGDWDKDNFSGHSSSYGAQDSYIKSQIGVKADIGDGFKVFGQIKHSVGEGGYAKGVDNNGAYRANRYNGSAANTTSAFVLRQAYLEWGTDSFTTLLGRQGFNTIWTDDYVGLAAKASYKVNGLQFTAFMIDAFEQGQNGDQMNPDNYGTDALSALMQSDGTTPALTNYNALWNKNFYGASAIADYNIGNQNINAQLWLGYFAQRATYWAADLKYTLNITDTMSSSFMADYLGNTIDSYFKERGFDNGQYIGGKAAFKFMGLDASVGGMMYGKKDKLTMNTIQDYGSLNTTAGREMIYMTGSKITDSFGENRYGYATLGYSINNVRVGAQYVLGSTKANINMSDTAYRLGAGDKQEIVGEASYQFNKNLNFSYWYSSLSIKQDYTLDTQNATRKSTKNTMRFQTIYRF